MAYRHHNLFWGSSYDRGLDKLLFIWEDIKKKFPDAELHIAYGWQTFLKLAGNNPERMEWKEKMDVLMQQDGVFHHGRLNKTDLGALMDKCGILAYTTDFFEINCITALDCQKHGCVPVVMNFDTKLEDGTLTKTALDETVLRGIKVEGDILTKEGRDKYLEAIFSLMSDFKKWQKLSTAGKYAITKYHWDKIALKWGKEFAKPNREPLVTIITPTIRKGFWRTMADNIASQSYRNVEWVVVDDFPKNREKTMKAECDRVGLKYQYLRGGKTDKFYFGLSSANNIAWKHAKGELLVFLQDFVYMPPNGIEMYVDWYLKHPNDLIAGVDVYHHPAFKPDVEDEDWFNGSNDFIGEFQWKNSRVKNMGITQEEHPTMWEANYGAVPKKVIDGIGGWWEFFNDGLGFDNTEMAQRAMLNGSKLWVDDTNVATCIEHWKALEDKPEQIGEGRNRRLNDPRYLWLINMIRAGKLTAIRDEKMDTFRLEYEIPKEVTDKETTAWIRKHSKEIAKSWENIL